MSLIPTLGVVESGSGAWQYSGFTLCSVGQHLEPDM